MLTLLLDIYNLDPFEDDDDEYPYICGVQMGWYHPERVGFVMKVIRPAPRQPHPERRSEAAQDPIYGAEPQRVILLTAPVGSKTNPQETNPVESKPERANESQEKSPVVGLKAGSRHQAIQLSIPPGNRTAENDHEGRQEPAVKGATGGGERAKTGGGIEVWATGETGEKGGIQTWDKSEK